MHFYLFFHRPICIRPFCTIFTAFFLSLPGTQALATTFIGTVSYMSPERVNGQDYGYASDVWALVTSHLDLQQQL